ncbi:MAG: YhdP family protein [Pseudoxanthomonas suwonensis]|nr:YhdP family protein [Pseudoxanthomonas suwonensis]
MPTPLRRGLRHAGRGSWYLLALCAVLVALSMGAVWQGMRTIRDNPAAVAQWLGDRAGRTVAFDAVSTGWTRRGPLLRLENLRVGEPGQAVEVGDAELVVSQYAGLLPGRALTELRIRGLDLALERDAAGRWQVRGLPGEQGGGGDPLEALQSLGELQVVGARIAIHAPDLGIDSVLSHVDLRLQVEGDRVRAGARARLAADGVPVTAVVELDRRAGDGRAWFNARRTDLAEWSPMLQLAGVRAETGAGQSQAWLQLRGNRVVALTAQASLTDVRLGGAAPAPGAGRVHSDFATIDSLLRWQLLDEGWRLDAPRLRLEPAGRGTQVLDGLVLGGGRSLALQAEQVDIGPLLSVLALSDRVPDELRRWLLVARPDARLSQVALAARRDGGLRVSGHIADARFAAHGEAPGLRGLSGALVGDSDGMHLQLDEAAQVEFDWPRGFGVVHPVRLRGDVSAWREAGGWRVATPALRVQGRDFAADARGGLWWQGDGSRPWIDLAARLDPAPVPVAKGFWVHHLMPETAVAWLDMALAGGTLADGYALVSGDLDDWPFTDNNGRFEAGGRIRDATLRFQPDWPAATQVDGEVRFIGNGFRVSGRSGQLSGVAIERFQAGIEDFGRSGLAVTANGRGDAARMLQLLRESPLQKQHGEALATLAAAGPAALDFRLDLPTHVPGAAARIGGNVRLQGVRLAESEHQLVFDQVRGSARYDGGGFVAEDLQVLHKGEPGRLSLRVGDHVRGEGNGFEADLDARLDARELLARAPMLDWLAPHVRGVSPWTIGVAMPRTASGQPGRATRLTLRSSLTGTTLDLPAPLAKPATQALATRIDAALPLGSGEVQVAFADRLALRARDSGGRTGVRVMLGQHQVVEAPPRSGIAIGGRTPQLDALDWMALLPGGESGGGNGGQGRGMALQSADIHVGRLDMLGSQFADTRVQMVPSGAATALRFDGPALAGRLQLPASRHAAVQGRLQRLHWTRAPGAARATPTSAAGVDVDPARIPPLEIDVDDLRVGTAALGTARLRTRPVAGGMHVVQMQTRGPGQSIDAQGQWLGQGAAAQTRLVANISSDDAGSLLAAFGMAGQLRGGNGQVHGEMRWPGGPAQFRLPALEGSAQLDIADGQLVEIEPGAGRVLGLVGLAQLPRRLTLDFRDFFDKGFAFDRIHGQVRMGGGSARSDNLRIEGPAADILIRGSADLRAQTYNQTIEVHPHTGNLLPVAGALAGGPVGAAIGAAANLVLRRPLAQVGARTYRVTGPWKDPVVRTTGQGSGGADAPGPAAPQ